MRMMSVEWLMNNAIFNDKNDNETKWEMFEKKLRHISWSFVASVEKHGVKAGVVYNEYDNTFYNGHHRLLIAYLLGIKEVPVFISCEDEFSSSDIAHEMNGWPAAQEWGNI